MEKAEEESSFNTPTIELPSTIFKKNGFKVFAKFEGTNPTGTQKDRIAFLHVKRARELGYNGITAATCGNYGASIAYFSRILGLKAKIFVPEGFHPYRLKKYLGKDVEIVWVKGYFEDAVFRSIEFAEENNFYDANPGSKNSEVDCEGYKSISYEILMKLEREPDIVVVPVGNGTTLYGVYEGFRELRNKGIIDRIPRIVGVAPAYANPIVASFLRGSKEYKDLKPEEIKITEENEPLANYKSFDGEKAFRAIKVSNGFAVSVNEEEMVEGARMLKSIGGINALPASASAFVALFKIPHEELHGKVVVSLITGRDQKNEEE